jgi:hypothetical protein
LIAIKDADEGAVCLGVARWDGRRLFWERPGSRAIEIPEHRLAEVRRTNEELREIVGDAEFLVTLSIQNISDEEAEGYEQTGLKWPAE